MNTILAGKVLWSYDYELLERDTSNDFSFHFGIPFHKHAGEIALTDDSLILVEEDELTIPFPSIEEIALGFDENFPNTLVKNLGLFWQPLRITLRTGENIYLIIDFNLLLGPKNQFWFKALKEMLSD